MEKFDLWPLNENYTEILRLDMLLTAAEIPHTLDRMFDGWIVCYPTRKHPELVCDAIEHRGNAWDGSDIIEIMGLCGDEDVENGLTAQEVFDRIKTDWIARGGTKNA